MNDNTPFYIVIGTMVICTAAVFLTIFNYSRTPPPKFHYKDNVVVTGGFFSGQSGIVVDFKTFRGKNSYMLRHDDSHDFIEEENLKLEK